MITALIVVVHVLVCLIMIGVILLQSGKGAEIGAAFGGSSQTIFGSRGAATFLSKMTVGAATLFMLTSLSLSLLSKQGSIAPSIVDTIPSAAAPLAP
ncbi:MAG: preprotein translocase subunit SecG [Nitrospiria bacterium]